MIQCLIKIETDVAEIKRIITGVDTETEDDGHQSPTRNDQQPPSGPFGAPPIGGPSSTIPPPLPLSSLPLNQSPPNNTPPPSPSPLNQICSLTLVIPLRSNDAKKVENFTKSTTNVGAGMNTEDIHDQFDVGNDVSDEVYCINLSFIDAVPL